MPFTHPRCLTTALSIPHTDTPPKTSASLNMALLPTALHHLMGLEAYSEAQAANSQYSQSLGCCEPSASDHMALVLQAPGRSVLNIFEGWPMSL